MSLIGKKVGIYIPKTEEQKNVPKPIEPTQSQMYAHRYMHPELTYDTMLEEYEKAEAEWYEEKRNPNVYAEGVIIDKVRGVVDASTSSRNINGDVIHGFENVIVDFYLIQIGDTVVDWVCTRSLRIID